MLLLSCPLGPLATTTTTSVDVRVRVLCELVEVGLLVGVVLPLLLELVFEGTGVVLLEGDGEVAVERVLLDVGEGEGEGT